MVVVQQLGSGENMSSDALVCSDIAALFCVLSLVKEIRGGPKPFTLWVKNYSVIFKKYIILMKIS